MVRKSTPKWPQNDLQNGHKIHPKSWAARALAPVLCPLSYLGLQCPPWAPPGLHFGAVWPLQGSILNNFGRSRLHFQPKKCSRTPHLGPHTAHQTTHHKPGLCWIEKESHFIEKHPTNQKKKNWIVGSNTHHHTPHTTHAPHTQTYRNWYECQYQYRWRKQNEMYILWNPPAQVPWARRLDSFQPFTFLLYIPHPLGMGLPIPYPFPAPPIFLPVKVSKALVGSFFAFFPDPKCMQNLITISMPKRSPKWPQNGPKNYPKIT